MDSGSGRTEPHPMANEMVDPEEIRPAPETEQEQRRHALPREERRVGRQLLFAVGGVSVIAIILAVIFSPEPWLIGLAALIFVAYMLLILAPVILASGTKAAQDEHTRQGS